MTEQPKPELPKAETKEQDNFKFELIYLVPILASLIFGLGCAYLLAPQETGGIQAVPIIGDSPEAAFGNGLYFVILIALAAAVFYVLIKRKNKRVIKGLIVLSMTTASLLLSVVYLLALFPYFEGVYYVIAASAIGITILFDLCYLPFRQ